MNDVEKNNQTGASAVRQSLIQDVRQIIETARANAVRSVDFCRVQMYWHLGQRIFEEEQHGKERADYGTYLTRNLAKLLEPEYGSGFGVRQLELARQFYRTYPIANTLRSQLNWSQYRRLIQIDDPDKREYYELESDENPTIGILLCTEKNDTVVKMTLPEDNKTILASEYQLYLPTTEQLVNEVNEVKKRVKKTES